MPDGLRKASEFGGRVTSRNRVQPRMTPTGKAGHVPTPSEELMLTYTTGDPTGLSDPDDGQAFTGLSKDPS